MGIQTFEDQLGGETAEDVLLEIAARIQISPTKHEQAETHYKALCEYVDRVDSPLHGQLGDCYASGSFGIGAATASNVARSQHDIDIVLSVKGKTRPDPEWMLATLFEAINGSEGSKYFGKVEQQSRCVTVTYDDGVTVDLMPVWEYDLGPARAGDLFEFKDGISATKVVNPYAFRELFNGSVVADANFARKLRQQRFLVEKAHAEEMPEHLPLEQKSARVVALQLLKRYRDVQYRSVGRKGLRKPPSIVMAALALDLPPAGDDIVAELRAQAENLLGSLQSAHRNGVLLEVRNPAYEPDVFTDRWPASQHDQTTFALDLGTLITKLDEWSKARFNPKSLAGEIKPIFGETVATYLVERYLERRRDEADAGALRFGSGGRVAATAGAAAASTVAAKPSTNFGGSAPE